MSNTSTVRAAVSELVARAGSRPAPALIGFDASRHLTRGDFGAVSPLVLDMPISEETIVGTAIGLALSGRDVVVDLMFEGFLSRCVEPLLVGWPTALALAQITPGRVVLRMLGSPIEFGGPSHSAEMLRLIGIGNSVAVVHTTSPYDVAWAVAAVASKQVLILADPSRPNLVRGDTMPSVDGDSPPLRMWRRGARQLAVCVHSELAGVVELVDAGTLDADVLSSPAACLPLRTFGHLLDQYQEVSFHGVSLADD